MNSTNKLCYIYAYFLSYYKGNKFNHVSIANIKSYPKDSGYDLIILPKADIELSLANPYYFSLSSLSFSTFKESTNAFNKDCETYKYNS